MKRFLIILLMLCTLNAWSKPQPVKGGKDIRASAQDRKKKDAKTTEPVVILAADTDGDGVPDSEDLCPDIPGPATAKGCPDTDGDGVPDFEDDCPSVPGPAKYRGCPDTDGDGVPDNKDVCLREKGPASNNGCPVVPASEEPMAFISGRDSSEINLAIGSEYDPYGRPGEEVMNEYEKFIYEQEQKKNQPLYIEIVGGNNSDRKPRTGVQPDRKATQSDSSATSAPSASVQATQATNVPGTVTSTKTDTSSKLYINSPVTLSSVDSERVVRLVKNVEFEQGRITLTAAGAGALDDLADILRIHPDWTVVFHCFTNEADNNYRNLQLSVNRGSAIKSYLVGKKNITPARITHKGYGNALDTIASDSVILRSHIDMEISAE